MFPGIENFQTYTVNETPIPTNWGFDSVSCSVTSANGGSAPITGASVAIHLEEGENWTCTYLDSLRVGTLQIVKKVTNDNGGTKTVGDFGLASSAGTLVFDAGTLVGSTKTYTAAALTVNAGSYTFDEINVDGYTEGTWSCTGASATGTAFNAGSVTVPNGGAVVCTITNNDQAGTLQIVKKVTNDNGGTKTVGDFGLASSAGTLVFDAGTLVGSTKTYTAAALTVNAGSYTFDEINVDGYTEGTWSCTGASATGTAFNAGSVTVPNGGAVVCTITNNDQAGTLQIVKKVTNDNGGTKTVGDFGLASSAGTLVFDAGTLVGSTKTYTAAALTVNAGSYTFDEINVDGYTEGTWSCTGASATGTAFNAGSVTVPNGGAVVCTITNNDQAGTLQIVKKVTNDNGGTKTVGDFGLASSAGTLVFDAGTLVGSTKTYTAAALTVNAGSYTFDEINVDGYTEGTWSCTGASATGTAFNAGSVTVPNGGAVVCTITNNDQAGTLQIVKKVTNDNGGTKTVGDFGLASSAGTLVFDAGTLVGSTKTYTAAALTVNAGSYTFDEINVDGYTEGTWSCTGASATGTAFNAGSVTVPNGGAVVCTITNNDQAGTLQIVKKVTNDNGGTKTVGDFGLASSAGTLVFDAGTLVGSTKTYTAAALTVNAGSYTFDEINVDGYTEGTWSCTGASATGTAFNAGSVTVPNGGAVVCTITNNDQAGTLQIVKKVTNDNGGTKTVGDFGLASSAGTLVFDAGTLVGSTKTYTAAALTVNAGSYTFDEINVDGYTEGTWSCTGASATGTAFNAGSVTVPNGGAVVCTITNNDQAGTLQIVKKVTNDNGGTKTVGDFGLASSAGTLVFDAGTLVGSTKTYTAAALTVNAGSYTFDEINVDGYTEGTWSCTGASATGTAFNAGSVTVPNGGAVVCTITNNDQAGTLQIVKKVTNDNGGTKTVGDFGLASSAGTLVFDAGTLVGSTKTYTAAALTVNAGSYTFDEINVDGYTEGTWSCTGASATGTAFNAGSVTVPNGGAVVCTITNNDQPGTIVITKVIKPVGALTSFSFDAMGTGYDDFSLAGGQSNSTTLNAGLYSVKELVPLGWVLTGIGGSTDPLTPYNCTITGSGGSTGVGDLNTQTATVSLKNGDTVTCVFENTGQGVTRTQGFWATHTPLANIAWFGGTAFGHTFPGVAATAGIGDKTLCGRLDRYARQAHGRLLERRLEDVRGQEAERHRSGQDAASPAAPRRGAERIGVRIRAEQWHIRCVGERLLQWHQHDKTAQQQAASFNTNGDSSTFTPGTSADSKNARAIATYTWWDVLP